MASIKTITSYLALITLTLAGADAVQAAGTLTEDADSPVSMGDFCGTPYVKYTGVLAGETDPGNPATAYRVPFVIRTPADPEQGNGVTLYEFPHFGSKDFSRVFLGYDFLFCRGFSQAAVGYDNRTGFGVGANRILDQSIPGVYIGGVGNRNMDVGIMTDFAEALAKKKQGQDFLGNNSRTRYTAGFSNGSNPLITYLDSRQASGLFDFAMPYVTDGNTDDDTRTLKQVLGDGNYTGKVIVVNDEYFESEVTEGSLHDTNPALREQYRYYTTAGSPHIPDVFNCRSFIPTRHTTDNTTPGTFHPELRARFLQGHLWVTSRSPQLEPPPSTQLAGYDAKGNARIIDIHGNLQPRLPFVELGEATYLWNNTGLGLPFPFYRFVGSVVDLEVIDPLNDPEAGDFFASHEDYLRAFQEASEDYKQAGAMLEEDEEFFLEAAAADPPLTMTQVYKLNYEGGFADPDRPNCTALDDDR